MAYFVLICRPTSPVEKAWNSMGSWAETKNRYKN